MSENIILTLKFKNYSGFKKEDIRVYNPSYTIEQIKNDMNDVISNR